MHITLPVIGTRGDIQPFIVLAKGLKASGYEVTLAAPKNYEAWILDSGLDFFPLMDDIQPLLKSNSGLRALESSRNLFATVSGLRDMFTPIVQEIAVNLWQATHHTDAIVADIWMSTLSMSVAEVRDIPLLQVCLQPLAETSEFPNLFFPTLPDWLPGAGLYNLSSYFLSKQILWLVCGKHINEFRQKFLGLSPIGSRQFIDRLHSVPRLNCFSSHVVPQPAEWPSNYHTSGFLTFEDDAWEPPQALVDFLADGPPPVYVGFGSMAGNDPEGAARTIVAALEQSGQRGILLTGWGGIKAIDVPDHILVINYASHHWLFPRMAAVVHHGGAGTTAAGLKAGVPTVVVPFFSDQFFWGDRVAKLGVGATSIPYRKLTSEKLAEAIIQVTSDEEIKANARQLGGLMRLENGLENAVELLSSYLKQSAVVAC